MQSFVYTLTGAILIVVGIVVSQSGMRVRINGRVAGRQEASSAMNAVGGGLGALGAIFAVIGVIGLVRGSQANKRNRQIMQTGIDAEGTVTFVDKNYNALVNNRPIYSIVEYTYQDSAGTQHARRVTNISSDSVIRMQIQVGSRIRIKVAAENPAESVIVVTA